MNKLRRKINEIAGSETGQIIGFVSGAIVGSVLFLIAAPFLVIIAVWISLGIRKEIKKACEA